MGFFDWLGFLVPGKKRASAERLSEKGFIPSGGEATTPKILLTPIANDKGGTATKALGALLTDIVGVEVFQLKKTLKVPDTIEDPLARLVMAAEEGRAWMREQGADVLIWGDVTKETGGLSLRVLPAPGSGGDQTQATGNGETLEIPADFPADLTPLIAAMVIGTFGPTFKGARARLGETLGGYLEHVAPMAENPPGGLLDSQELSILNAIGNIYVAYCHLGGGASQLDLAARAYSQAEKKVSKENQPLAWASVQNHLAAVLQTQGQMKKDSQSMRQAAVIYSNIGATLSESANPHEWGAAQANLGRTLYILAGLEGKPEYLKRAGGAYEAALKACDKNINPGRWAEVTNQYGVVLLAFGEEAGVDAVLEKAVSRFRDAMGVHKRDTSPILWAQTANNLGAACFALAKRNSQNSLLREASDCFEGATEVYRQQGVAKQAEVIGKNLHRVKRLLMTRGG
jgi:tetratricopeptide (TPR) repeat protein